MPKLVNKPRKSASKRKGKVVVRQKIEVRSKSKETAKKDTLTTQMPRSNGAILKVKVKRK